MMRKMIAVLAVVALFGGGLVFAQDTDSDEQIAKLKKDIKDLEKRVMKNERKTALDRINFIGDFRFEVNSIQAEFGDRFNGMELQRLMVDNLFYVNGTGNFPPSQDDVSGFIAQNYADYLYYLDNVVTFDWLKNVVGQFPPEMVQQFMGMLLPHTYEEGYDYKNTLLYTNRLRLQMDAKVSKSVDFSGRLSMYKAWGDSTGVQVFNGQPTSINVDGTTAAVPNSDIVRVERVYFTWKSPKFYLSIGRRPSTGGMPLNFRQDEPRGGTPVGSIINYQFDGATFGWNISDKSTFRLCYGVGFESGFGNGELTQRPEDRLKDAWFLGINWDVYKTENVFIQASIAGAFDVTDGFNGLVVLPIDPVTGQDVPAPVVLRYTPSANLGDIYWASVVGIYNPGRFDLFATLSYMESNPSDVTTPFGGMFSDPFETPEKQDGYMYYLGARYSFANDKTKLGLEYNKGSQYWFNMAVAEDDLIAPKTSVRGDVVEVYLTHRIAKRFIFRATYMHYNFDYSQSGWHMGAAKPLDSTPPPILGFPSPTSMDKFLLGLTARF